MSVTGEFWKYAKEAALAACYAESDDEEQEFSILRGTWTQAALIERRMGSMASLREAPSIGPKGLSLP